MRGSRWVAGVFAGVETSLARFDAEEMRWLVGCMDLRFVDGAYWWGRTFVGRDDNVGPLGVMPS